MTHTKHIWIKIFVSIFIVGIVAGLSLTVLQKKQAGREYPFAIATMLPIGETIVVTGKVQPKTSVTLAFDRSGRIARADLKIGQLVKKGDLLVSLDSADLEASRAQANASLSLEQARLQELRRGPRIEDIRVSEAQAASAGDAVMSAEKNLDEKLESAYTSFDDLLHSNIDNFFDYGRSWTPSLKTPTVNAFASDDISKLRRDLETAYTSWTDTKRSKDRTELVVSVEKNLVALRNLFDRINTEISQVRPGQTYTQAQLDAWKLQLSTGRTTLNNNTLAMVDGANTQLKGVKSAAVVAKEQLAQRSAPATPDTIAQQEARVASAAAAVRSIDAQLSHSRLTAPMSGVITKYDAKPGASAIAGNPLVHIETAGYEVVVNVPEKSLGHLTVGDQSTITLDAFGANKPFQAIVSAIDPAETIVGGVSTYRTTLDFISSSTEQLIGIRSGMTASANIAAKEKNMRLVVPRIAVHSSNNKKSVMLLMAGNTIVETPVTVGIVSDGLIEITSGIKERDRIVTIMPAE